MRYQQLQIEPGLQLEATALVVMCANCRKIQDDAGTWYNPDSHRLASIAHVISHGLCEECAHELYPDVFPEICASLAGKRA